MVPDWIKSFLSDRTQQISYFRLSTAILLQLLVTINALYSTSNVSSFLADCKTIILVYCLMPIIHVVENRKYK